MSKLSNYLKSVSMRKQGRTTVVIHGVVLAVVVVYVGNLSTDDGDARDEA